MQLQAWTELHHEIGPSRRRDERLSLRNVDVRWYALHQCEFSPRLCLLLLISPAHHLGSKKLTSLPEADLVNDRGSTLAQLLELIIGHLKLVFERISPYLLDLEERVAAGLEP